MSQLKRWASPAGSAVIAVTLSCALASCSSTTSASGSGASSSLSTGSSAATAPVSAGAATCSYPKSGAAARDVGVPPEQPVTRAAAIVATLQTNQGAITLTLDASKAPCTVNSFLYLAGKKYFDATPCHRLTTSGIYVLQCGDPTGTGSGTPGYSFADENLDGASYPAGTVAMANAGPNTNGSQFFLVYKDTQLPPSYTPFGTITAGLDVVQKIAAAGSDNSNGPGDGKPRLAVTIAHVTTPAS